MTDFAALLSDQELVAIIESDDIDELRELHDRLADQIAAVDHKLRDLEDREARDYEREVRSDYAASR